MAPLRPQQFKTNPVTNATNFSLKRPATSGSWRTSTPARRRRPSASSSTPAVPTRWERSTRAPRSWTGWSRSRSAGSRSPRPRRPASGRAIGSTSSTRRATSTSREVERSLRVLDGAIAIFDSVAGVEPQSETVWRQADKYRVPRIAYVNKMDLTGADFPARSRRCVTALAPTRCRFSCRSARGRVQGVVDLIENKALVWNDELGTEFTYQEIPAELAEGPRRAHPADRGLRRLRRRADGGLPGRVRRSRTSGSPSRFIAPRWTSR